MSGPKFLAAFVAVVMLSAVAYMSYITQPSRAGAAVQASHDNAVQEAMQDAQNPWRDKH
jgi:hypothetical protein